MQAKFEHFIKNRKISPFLSPCQI